MDWKKWKDGMYGSAVELSNNLDIYHSFDQSTKYFGTDPYEHFNKRTPEGTFTKEIKNRLNKTDFIIDFKQWCSAGLTETDHFFYSFMALFLKLKSNELESLCNEFFPFEEDCLTDFYENMKQTVENPAETTSYITFNLSNFTFDELCQNYKKLFPDELGDSLNDIFKEIFTVSYGPEPLKPSLLSKCERDFFRVFEIFSVIRDIMKGQPHVFLPHNQVPNNPFPRNVRVYISYKSRIVMVDEVRMFLGESLISNGDDIIVKAISEEDFLEKYEDRFDSKTEIVYCQIRSAKHHPVPIMTLHGTFCVLPFDGLLSILRDLFFRVKLFQRVKPDSFQIANAFFNDMKMYFLEEESDSPYFLNLKVIDEVRESLENRFSELMKIPAKEVRNAKKDGFTVENLKNELKHLSLTDIFPSIGDYAQLAYDKVVLEKKMETLRTCDLFDAIEHCQLICLIQKFPFLLRFVQNQNACNRILYTPGFVCHEQNEWKEYTLNEVRLHKVTTFGAESSELFSVLIVGNGLELVYNVECIYANYPETKLDNEGFIKEHINLFIMEKSDNKISLDALRNVIAYKSLKPNAPLYLRTIYTSRINPESTKRVFSNDVLDVICAILRSQNCSSESIIDNIEKFSKKARLSNNNFTFPTMGMKELACVLDELKIDKKLFTLVPDIQSCSFFCFPMTNPSFIPLKKYYNPPFMIASSISDFTYFIFIEIVCKLHWKGVKCEKSSNCFQKFKTSVILNLVQLEERPEEDFLSIEILKKAIKLIPSCECLKPKTPFGTPYEELSECFTTDEISLAYFLKMAQNFNVSSVQCPVGYTQEQLEKATIPVWKAQIFFVHEWANEFFDEKMEKWKRQVINSMQFTIPLLRWESEDDIWKVLLDMKMGYMLPWNKVEHIYLTFLHSEKPKQWKTNKNIIRSPVWSHYNQYTKVKESKLVATEKASELHKICNRVLIDEQTHSEPAERMRRNKKSLEILRAMLGFNEKGERIERNKEVRPEIEDKNPFEDFSQLKESYELVNIKIQQKEMEAQMEQLKKENAHLKEEFWKQDQDAKRENLIILEKMGILEWQMIEQKISFEEESLKLNSELEKCRRQHAAEKENMKKNSKDTLEKCRQEHSSEKDRLNKQINDLKKALKAETKKCQNLEQKNREFLEKQKDSERIATEHTKELGEKTRLLEKCRQENSSERDRMNKQINDLKKMLEEEKKKSENLEQSNRNLFKKHQDLERTATEHSNELTEKTRLLEETKVSQQRLQVENEALNKHIQYLTDKLIDVASNHRVQRTSNSEPTELSEEMKQILFEFQTTRNILLNENGAQQVASHAHRLFTMSDDPHIREGAHYELREFNTNYEVFMKTIERNIEKIQKNVKITSDQLEKLPEFPSLPDGFMVAYEQVLKKKFEMGKPKEDVSKQSFSESQSTDPNELTDLECLICQDDMQTNQFTIKCENCKRRYHHSCAKKWLKQKKTCPVCSQTLLDPQEYPALP